MVELADKRQALNLSNKEIVSLNILYSPVKLAQQSPHKKAAKSKSPKRANSLQRTITKQAKATPVKAKSAPKERKPITVKVSEI